MDLVPEDQRKTVREGGGGGGGRVGGGGRGGGRGGGGGRGRRRGGRGGGGEGGGEGRGRGRIGGGGAYHKNLKNELRAVIIRISVAYRKCGWGGKLSFQNERGQRCIKCIKFSKV